MPFFLVLSEKKRQKRQGTSGVVEKNFRFMLNKPIDPVDKKLKYNVLMTFYNNL